jgi:Na+/H+ antiporter NhaC
MKSFFKTLFLILFIFNFISSEVRANYIISSTDSVFLSKDINVEFPKFIVKNVKTEIKLILNNDKQKKYYNGKEIKVFVNGDLIKVKVSEGTASFHYKFISKGDVNISVDNFRYKKYVNPIPLWLSIIPPLIAIIIALLFKEVFSALFIGIFSGTLIMFYFQGQSFFAGFFKALFAVADTYILQSLNNSNHISIIIFSMLIGGMVSLITKNGGMRGVVNIFSKYAKTSRSGQFMTWLLGIAIFFDDYANTLVVGSTMRPVADKLKISREKLAYIVDSTAAPVASIAFVTTWIGIELSYINDGIASVGINESAYNVFINSLNTRFYPVFALIFVLILIIEKRDFGPMFYAEKRAKVSKASNLTNNNGNSDNVKISDNNTKWFNAAIPVLIIIFGTIAGLFYTGWDSNVWNNDNIAFSTKLSTIIGGSDSYKSLIWSSLFGVFIAILLTTGQRILTLKDSIDSLIKGFKTMLTAILILILAWSLALVTENMHTADFISQSLININVSPFLLPSLTFILAGLISFATGSSWGTMAVLYPLILPASWLISKNYGMDYSESLSIFYNVVSSILAGSVLGDHCSPISDTTILSSLASSCNHIEHVRTQLPYAVTVGCVSVIFGTIPSAYGVSSWILFPVGFLVMYFIIKLFGKKVEIF